LNPTHGLQALPEIFLLKNSMKNNSPEGLSLITKITHWCNIPLHDHNKLVGMCSDIVKYGKAVMEVVGGILCKFVSRTPEAPLLLAGTTGGGAGGGDASMVQQVWLMGREGERVVWPWSGDWSERSGEGKLNHISCASSCMQRLEISIQNLLPSLPLKKLPNSDIPSWPCCGML
jgi:hypothetical protein